jgi:hypothetical protein
MSMIRFETILLPYSSVIPTGSYYLDVMAYPDIDLYITEVSVEQLFKIGARIAASDLVTQVVFERFDDSMHMPGGLYLKTKLNVGDWGRPWKIDLWSLPESVIIRKVEEMYQFLCKMTPYMREQIIRYKLSVLTPQKRTPRYSGIYIYKAFIDEGLTDFEDVTRFLISNGIEVEGQN